MTSNEWANLRIAFVTIVLIFTFVAVFYTSMKTLPPPAKINQPNICELENRGAAVYCDGVLCDCTENEANYSGTMW